MFKNYLLTAVRALGKNKVSSIINISGLAIGMACCLTIFIYVKNERSYDNFHSKSDRIFRFYTVDEALGVSSNQVAITEPAMPRAAKAEIPEVVNTTRILTQNRVRVEVDENYVYAEDAKSVEPSFFEIFDFELVNPEAIEAFDQPRKAILTQTMAKKLFGTQPAVGKLLKINDDDWEVVGLLKDNRKKSHLQLDLLLSLYPTQADSSLAQYLDSWQGLGMVGYALLSNASAQTKVEAQMKDLALKNDAPKYWIPHLQPLQDIHLQSAGILFDGYNTNKGDITYVYSLSAVAFFILLIAAFNFMNLSTAQSSTRAKEVGVRKVLGAIRFHLIKQHLGESLLVCVLAAILALLLVLLIGPYLRLALDTTLLNFIFGQPAVYLSIIFAILIIGILAGLYPAFILSKFEAVSILRGKFQTSTKGILLRKILVITQFVASITMIIGTVLIYQQLTFIKNKSLGFDKDQIVTLKMNDPGLAQNMKAFEDQLRKYETVEGVTASSNMPGRTFGRVGITPEGATDQEQNWIVSAFSFDEHYLDVMDMRLVQGRNYDPEYGTDQDEGVLVNEALVEQVGWENPIGKKITFGDNERTIIGVVKNFHFASMRHSIEPLIMLYNPDVNSNLSVKIKGNIRKTMKSFETEWKAIYPNYPFEYQFFDQEFSNLFKNDENFSYLVYNFTWLAIFIACLGLFGLSMHMAEQRRKEIGVRKVLGASIPQIVTLLSKEFIWLITVATILAWPLAYLAVKSWLGEFQYRIDLLSLENLGIFLLSGMVALVIGLLTVSYQSIAAAVVNPVKSLRIE